MNMEQVQLLLEEWDDKTKEKLNGFNRRIENAKNEKQISNVIQELKGEIDPIYKTVVEDNSLFSLPTVFYTALFTAVGMSVPSSFMLAALFVVATKYYKRYMFMDDHIEEADARSYERFVYFLLAKAIVKYSTLKVGL